MRPIWTKLTVVFPWSTCATTPKFLIPLLFLMLYSVESESPPSTFIFVLLLVDRVRWKEEAGLLHQTDCSLMGNATADVIARSLEPIIIDIISYQIAFCMWLTFPAGWLVWNYQHEWQCKLFSAIATEAAVMRWKFVGFRHSQLL